MRLGYEEVDFLLRIVGGTLAKIQRPRKIRPFRFFIGRENFASRDTPEICYLS